MHRLSALLYLGSMIMVAGCGEKTPSERGSTFQADLEFLQRHTNVVLLKHISNQAQVAVVPAWQGRVMTSTNGGAEGPSFGWVNYDLIESGTTLPHINPYGGEDRFWMGPEGGQFSIFFKQGDPFDFDHWQTPACIDTDRWEAVSASQTSVTFSHAVSLTNYSGTALDLRIDRTVKLLDDSDIENFLGTARPDHIQAVGFESDNQITNLGEEEWKKQTGLPSIWVLGMYIPSPTTTVIVPFRQGTEDALGPIVNDSYFGKVPSDRLEVKESIIFFKADGKHRSKIGLNPQRALGVAGSYDSSRNLLTIVHYDQPEGATEYVNSMWEIQEEPYAGDVINSYNDGPPEPGAKPMGPFYELETSSPAASLQPGEAIRHNHRTFHFTGPSPGIEAIARAVLGVDLSEIPD